MVSFSIPITSGSYLCGSSKHKGDFFNFSVNYGRVVFAGSRYGHVEPETCRLLINRLGSLGFSFATGCAPGVDKCFREALSVSEFSESSLAACAFKERADKIKGIYSLFVVPESLPPKAALAKRTLWMTSRCSMLILFPFGYAQGRPSGTIASRLMGKGSALAFKSTIMNNKPVFLVTDTRPKDSELYTVIKSNLFGIVDGFWAVPPVYQQTGLSYEVV